MAELDETARKLTIKLVYYGPATRDGSFPSGIFKRYQRRTMG